MVERKTLEDLRKERGLPAWVGVTPNGSLYRKFGKHHSRPRQHARSGSVTAKGYRSPTTVNVGFHQALAINQVGARPLKHHKHTYYELGGGLFTKKQVLESRRRFGEVKYNLHISKEKVGM